MELLLFRDFHPRKLPLEFLDISDKSLENLDEITKLRYENNLPQHIHGNLCNSLIRTYQSWKGTKYVPLTVHSNLKWTSKDPFPLLPDIKDSSWQILNKTSITKQMKTQETSLNQVSNFVPAKGSISINTQK